MFAGDTTGASVGNAKQSSGIMKAVIYCRVSTKDQTTNLSLPTQLKACTDFCHNHGLEVDKIFTEEGESAKTTDRPAFLQLLSYCREKKGHIQAVVVYSISRFARNSHDFHAIKGFLAGLGISLRSVTEPTDETSTGKLMEGILAAFAQFDNDVRAERTVAGMKAARDRGRWTFQAPLGYLNSRNVMGQPTLIHDPHRAPMIRKAFELYATGTYSKRQVLRIISSTGLRTRRGVKLSAQSFDTLLRNPLYAGWISVTRWGESRRAAFEPLVDQHTFDHVQQVLAGKRHTVTPYVRNHPDFPLRRFIRCGICGKPVTGSWCKGRSKPYAYYRCPNTKCHGVKIRKESFEKLFVNLLERLKPSPEYVRLFAAIVLDVWKEKHADSLIRIAALEDRLKTLSWQKEQVIDAFLYRHAIDKAVFDDQLAKLREETTIVEMDLFCANSWMGLWSVKQLKSRTGKATASPAGLTICRFFLPGLWFQRWWRPQRDVMGLGTLNFKELVNWQLKRVFQYTLGFETRDSPQFPFSALAARISNGF